MKYLREFRKRFEMEYGEEFDDSREIPQIELEKFFNKKIK